MGEKRYAYRLLVEKPQEKSPLGRPICRCMDNIKVDPVEIGWGGVAWIGLTQDMDKWRKNPCKRGNALLSSNIASVSLHLPEEGYIFSF
jgi:hypothetical protein